MGIRPDFRNLSSEVATLLESALPLAQRSPVVKHWITAVLAPYFASLPAERLTEYKVKSNLFFIALHDHPLDETLVTETVQCLEVYCSNGTVWEVLTIKRVCATRW